MKYLYLSVRTLCMMNCLFNRCAKTLATALGCSFKSIQSVVHYSCLCGLLQLEDSFSTVSICDDGSFYPNVEKNST